MESIRNNASKPVIQIPEYAVICCDSDDVIISWDVQAEKMFGWQHGDAIGRNLFDLLISGDKKSSGSSKLSTLFRAHRKDVSVTLQIKERATARNQLSFPVELIISPLPGGEYFTIFIHNLEVVRQNADVNATKAFQFEVISSILKMSLGPALLKDRLKAILEYTVSLDELDLLPIAALFLVEQNSQHLTLCVQHGLTLQQKLACRTVEFGSCFCGKAALTNKAQFIAKTPKKHYCQNLTDTPHGHYCIPFGNQGIVNGVLCLYIPENHQKTKQKEILLTTIAEIIGSIVDNQKMDFQLINLVNDLRGSILALREEQRFSDSIIQGLEHGLVITDHNGAIQKSNDVAKKILKPFCRELEGHNLSTVLGKESAARVLDTDRKRSSNEENELTLTTENGEELILRYSAVKKKDLNNHHDGAIISLTDVSEWRYVRKEMEKMNRLSTVAEIASAVAHEVRNPLAGIKIMAQSIEEDSGTTEERTECAQRIIRQVDRLNELLTDFFSYARPVVPKKQPTSLVSILAETKPLIINKLVKQRISLLEDFGKDLPHVVADPNQIQQVFLNLFLNSIDAIKQEGTIEITAQSLSGQKLTSYRKHSHLLEKGTSYVMVTFKDNGAGMPKEAEEKVFEPFFTTKTNGSGLGMSIVYRTLKENDATISVESEEGRGTTFTMFFKSN